MFTGPARGHGLYHGCGYTNLTYLLSSGHCSTTLTACVLATVVVVVVVVVVVILFTLGETKHYMLTPWSSYECPLYMPHLCVHLVAKDRGNSPSVN